MADPFDSSRKKIVTRDEKRPIHAPLPSISSEMGILSTSPVNDTLVFLLSIPEVPSNT